MSVRTARSFGVLAGILGLLLLASSFAVWFESAGDSADMWQAFAIVDLVVALAALCAVGAGIAAIVGERSGLAVVLATISCNVALLATILVLVRLIDPPLQDASREFGIWAGSALIVAILLTSLGAMGGGSPSRLSSAR